MRHLFLPAAALLASCGSDPQDVPANATVSSAPTETEAANTSLKGAFPGQTRAPTMSANLPLYVQEITSTLEAPWSLEFLPDGRVLVTEKGGAFRIVSRNGKVSERGTGLPRVDDRGQGGLLDVALDPDFAASRTIWWTFSEPRDGGNGTALARGRLSAGARPDVSDVQVVFRQMPTFDSELHYGSRIAFSPDGKLFLTLGERSELESRLGARKLDTHFGKVIRLNRDGSIPADNPFAREASALPGIWSVGHRNPQGLAFRDDGSLWVIEHGPRGGDELNRIEKGRDYGWPTITYGIEYGGETIGEGIAAASGLEQPVYYWDPVIAPSSLLFYDGAMFPEWQQSFFATALNGKLVRLTMNGERVAGEEWLLRERGGERYRDARQGPDGAIWLITDEGKLLRVARGS